MKSILAVCVVCCVALMVAWSALACDMCSVYRAMDGNTADSGILLGVSEEFTRCNTMQLDGAKVPNVAHQNMNSYRTQIVPGYQVNEHFGVQADLPYLYRSYTRPDGFSTDEGSVSGIGDASVLGYWRTLLLPSQASMIALDLLGGVKLPTGSSDRIKEETQESEPPPGAPVSGIHGHDLALGSGSYDGIVGIGASVHRHRFICTAAAEYAIRTEGDYEYRYANELSWNIKPGAFLLLSPERTLRLQCAVHGAEKGKDKFRGESAEDTGMREVLVGPELSFSCKGSIVGTVGADLPVYMNNTALQSVPDYRLFAAFTWRL